MAEFPFNFVRFIDFPMSVVDLYVKRADVTFDEFRVRCINEQFSIGSDFE